MPELPHIKFTIAEVERMIDQMRNGRSGLALDTLKSRHMDTLIELAVTSGQVLAAKASSDRLHKDDD